MINRRSGDSHAGRAQKLEGVHKGTLERTKHQSLPESLAIGSKRKEGRKERYQQATKSTNRKGCAILLFSIMSILSEHKRPPHAENHRNCESKGRRRQDNHRD